jgi:hypothetical protein
MLAGDTHIIARVAACVATQTHTDPLRFAWENAWRLSAEPGWDAAYAYAISANVTDPGNDEGCITDGMILSAVQALIAAEAGTS